MGKIKTLNELSGDDKTLDEILNKELIVLEDIQGSKIWMNFNGEKFEIRPKSFNNEPIRIIDLAMQNYYNRAVDFFNNLDNRVKSLIPKKWSFCFEYFPDNQPANIEYSKIPKNNLVLTAINKGGKWDYTIEELEEWSRLLDVDPIPVIFNGKLSETSKEAIIYFLNTSPDDLEYIFGEKNFAYFFFKLLNPHLSGSFLMDGQFSDNLEKLIIRTGDNSISFDIMNPLYKRMSLDNSTDFTDVYTLILVNFLTFCQSVDINLIKTKSNNRDSLYIEIISKLFNLYVESCGDDLINFEFTIPNFYDKEKFKINRDLILDKKTLEYIESNPKLEYIFKILLSSFNKKRKKPIGLFTDATVVIFNNFVDKIFTYIDNYLGKKREFNLKKRELLNFGDFFEIKWDSDSIGDVYPDIYNDIQRGSLDKKKGDKNKFSDKSNK
jgi:hypothetical protein